MTKAEKEKQHRRQVAISRLKLVLIVVCLIAIPVTFIVNHGETSDVRGRIAKAETPCLRYGSGSIQCKRSFEAAVATIDHAEACAVLRKAGLRVESCHGARLARERRRHVEESASPGPSGGDATSSPSTGHSLPTPGNGGHGVGKGGSGHAPVPGNSGSEGGGEPGDGSSASSPAPSSSSTSQQSSSSSTERLESTVVETPSQAPVAEGVGELVEEVGGTVREVGSTVSGTVEGVEATTCALAKLLCHE